jgi:hypothetical protein
MLQLSLDNVGELLCFHDRRRRFFADDRSRGRRSRSFHSGFSRLTQGAKMFPNLIGQFVVERAGMGFLLNPEYGEVLEDEVTLHLQFARQNVDSYVAHSLFLILSLASRPSLDRQAEICGLTH